MRPPNAPPGLPHHPVPGLCGTPGLYTNRHAVSYFTALLCGIPLSTGPPCPALSLDRGLPAGRQPRGSRRQPEQPPAPGAGPDRGYGAGAPAERTGRPPLSGLSVRCWGRRVSACPAAAPASREVGGCRVRSRHRSPHADGHGWSKAHCSPCSLHHSPRRPAGAAGARRPPRPRAGLLP